MTQEEIFSKYHDKIEHYIWGKVCDRYTAEDLTSIVFLKIYEKMNSYNEEKSSISTWIYTIANNTVIDYYRTHKIPEEISEEIAQLGEIDEDIIKEEELTTLADALKKIPEREKDILILRYYDNLTLKEIALKMGMSYANAKIVHAKALVHMKELIDIDDYPF